jgi:hypothetical protein
MMFWAVESEEECSQFLLLELLVAEERVLLRWLPTWQQSQTFGQFPGSWEQCEGHQHERVLVQKPGVVDLAYYREVDTR